jgi:hypothetical protein
MMTVGLFLQPDPRSAAAPIAGREAEVGMAGRAAVSRICRFRTSPVTVKLQLSRWTFTDRLPAIASPYVRRTTRVVEIVCLLGHNAGGRPGEHCMQRLRMPVGDDTILRQLNPDAVVVHFAPEIRVVGIDDWSWRRAT